MNVVTVDFNKTNGKMNPLNGVCCAPYVVNFGAQQHIIKEYFERGNIPLCRLHDCCGGYGGAYFVDIPNIFKNFDADENDPSNYE